MSHLGHVPSVGPFVSHGLSMPSVSMELTQLLTSNALQGQSLPSVSSTHDHFINNDVSANTVPVENCVTNAENRIVCHSKSSVVNFDSNAHSHFDNHAETHCNSLTNDKTKDIISRSSENFSDVSGQHISNLSSTKLLSNSEANEIDNLIGVIPSIKDKRFDQESDFDKFGRELVSQLYALGDQLKENKAISVTAIRNRLHAYQSQIGNIVLRMADNHTADCDNLIDWMDFAAGLPVCSQSFRLDFEIQRIRYAIDKTKVMGDNLKFKFSERKQSSNLRKQILLLVYDAKKLLKEEFSYMQSEVYRMEDDISKFNALVNLTVDGDIVQASRCPECSSRTPDAALIRQGPCLLYLDKFLGNRKHNAYKLYGQYADLCNTFEKYCVSFPASQPETHESINKIQTPMSPVNGTYPSDHYRKSGDSAQSLGSLTISSHQLEKTVSQVDGSDVTGKSEFERKLDSRFDQLIADLRNHLVSYWAGCHKFATQHETHESINKMKSPVSPVRGTNPSEKGNHYRKSGNSAQPLVSANISSHQVEKTVSQVDGSDVTGKSENISHNSHNSKFTDNTFDIMHETHNSLKLETSNMDKSIPVKMSMKNSYEERSHRGAFPRDQMKNACFHCRKLGHFAYECPDLCPPSRADKDSNWRHSMKQRNVHESKNGYRHFNQSPAQNSIDIHNVPSVQNNIISDISIIPQPHVCTVQKEIPVEHNVTSLGHHNSICDNVDLSHPKSNEHIHENSDTDICDHNVITSDFPDKSDNQQINEYTDISTPSLQINPDVRHHDSFASSVIGSLTSDNTNDDNITNSIKSVCPDPSTQNSVRLSDAICDAHDTNDTNIGSITPDVIAIKTVGDTLHDDDNDMNSVPLGVNEMLLEAYHVGSYIRELLENMVDFIVDHHVQESLVKCHGEDLAVDHNADSVVNLDDDESIVHHSDDESNDSDQHYEYPDGVGHQFEISHDVRRHTNTLSENDTTISGNFPMCLADVNILSSEMGDGDLSIGYHQVLFSDGANDFGNLCRNQMDANFVTLGVLLSSSFLQCLQAINDGVHGVGLANTYLCTKLFYVKKIRHRKEIYQLNS